MTEVPPLFSVLFPCPSVFSQRMATRKSKRTPGGKDAQKSRKPVTKGSKFQQPNCCGIMDCVLIIRPPRRPVARYQLYVYQTARGIYSAKEIREAYQATVESLTKKLKDALSRSDCRSLDCDSDFEDTRIFDLEPKFDDGDLKKEKGAWSPILIAVGLLDSSM
ncbi:hypothetical protein B0H14DRAFT_2650046 [Mycena olivaceomarginata]|nr:hypothetical protein B0H14DRAFT_2650046 [Mycena olivaceomarginata]